MSISTVIVSKGIIDPLLEALIDKFSTEKTSWYASIRPGNRSHLAPIWHVWHSQSIYVVTQPGSVRVRNLQFNDSVSLALPDSMNVVILEGKAILAENMMQELQPLFQSKYNWDIISDTAYHIIIRVIPTKLLAWGEHGEGRWKFDNVNREWSKIQI